MESILCKAAPRNTTMKPSLGKSQWGLPSSPHRKYSKQPPPVPNTGPAQGAVLTQAFIQCGPWEPRVLPNKIQTHVQEPNIQMLDQSRLCSGY